MNYVKVLLDLYKLKCNEKKSAGITKEQLPYLPLSAFPTINKKMLMEHFDELVTVPDVKQDDLRDFDATESKEKRPFGVTMWSIFPKVQGNRDILFMMKEHGPRCCLASSAEVCGECPCRRS